MADLFDSESSDDEKPIGALVRSDTVESGTRREEEAEIQKLQHKFIGVGSVVEASALAFGRAFAAGAPAGAAYRGVVVELEEDDEDDEDGRVWRVTYDDDGGTYSTAEAHLSLVSAAAPPAKRRRAAADDDDEDHVEEEEEDDDDDDDDDDAMEDSESDGYRAPRARAAAPRRSAPARRAAAATFVDDAGGEVRYTQSGRVIKAPERPVVTYDDYEKRSSSPRAGRGAKKRGKPAAKKAVAVRDDPRRVAARGGAVNYAEFGSSDDDDESDDSDAPRKKKKPKPAAEPDEPPVGIERLLCGFGLPKKAWRPWLAKMNTAQITDGSLFIQDDDERLPEDEEVRVSRYLVKWKQYSYLHCSWETERDLAEQVGAQETKRALQSLRLRESKGEVPDVGDPEPKRCFDPEMVDVERVLKLPECDLAPQKRTPLPLGDLPDASESSEDEDEDELAAAAGAVTASERKAFAAERYAFALKEANEKGDAQERAVRDAIGAYGAVALADDAKVTVKWRGLGYEEASDELWRDVLAACPDEEALLAAAALCGKRFCARKKRPKAKERQRRDGRSGRDAKRAVPLLPFRGGALTLRPYQIDGIGWLAHNFLLRRNSILADEMGLGKTVQSVSLVRMIKERYAATLPVLVVAPLSTLGHWDREFKHWTNLDVMVYHGSGPSRAWGRSLDLFARKDTKSPAVDVVVTTYEQILLDDAAPLARTKWSAIIVDEAHRLKNPQSRLYRALHGDDGRFASIFKLLLTGTPLQNDMRELWALLSFCDTETFGEDHEEFVAKYGGCAHDAPAQLAVVPEDEDDDDDEADAKPGVLSSLLEEMRPFVLRRVKAHVETSVPPKEEIVVSVALAAMQKRYYRALYEKNVTMLAGGGRAVDGPSMMNLAMELRKCCNHPFLLKGVEFRELESSGHGVAEVDRLVDACGKLQFMDKILPKLFDEQRKVLVFSQFTMMLNVLEDYLRARAVVYGRIDGGVTGRDRQRQIDAFSDAGSKMRLMLLSTRAGGVGINLVAADTVIIYDSDWNPQNDVQAMARCHRIGQTKKVTVYRLLTAKTYEAHMYDVATAKLDLDRAVLDGMASHSKGNAQLHESLLKRGATAVAFQQGPEEDDDADAVAFRNQSIDDILATRTKAVVLASNDSGGALESLSSATFVAARGAEGLGDVDLDDPDFWSKTVGAGYKSPGKKPEDRSARAARGGFKHYDEAGRTAYDAAYVDDGNSDDDAHASAFDRVKKKKRSKKEAQVDEDFEDAPKKEKPKHPHDWSKTQIRELRLQLQKRPIGLAGADFVRGGASLARREDPADALSAARDAIVSSAKASLLQGAYNADSEIQHGIDRAQVEKLWRRNKAVKHCLKHRALEQGAPEATADALAAALIAFEPTPGPLGVELCAAPGRDADGKHGKLLDVVNELETCRVLAARVDAYAVPPDAEGRALTANETLQALGLGRVSVCNRAAPWWDARHDLCLVRGVTKHGTLASEQRRVDVLEDASLGWPDDMPRPPPRLDVEPADADEVASNAPSQAPSSVDDAAPRADAAADAPDGAKAPEAKKPNPSRKAPKRLEHLPSRAKLNSRLKALVAAECVGADPAKPAPKRRKVAAKARAAGPFAASHHFAPKPAPAPADDPAKENGRDAPDRRDRAESAPAPAAPHRPAIPKKKKQTSMAAFFAKKPTPAAPGAAGPPAAPEWRPAARPPVPAPLPVSPAAAAAARSPVAIDLRGSPSPAPPAPPVTVDVRSPGAAPPPVVCVGAPAAAPPPVVRTGAPAAAPPPPLSADDAARNV